MKDLMQLRIFWFLLLSQCTKTALRESLMIKEAGFDSGQQKHVKVGIYNVPLLSMLLYQMVRFNTLKSLTP